MPEVALQQLAELGDVHLSPAVGASALVGVGLLIQGGDDEQPVLLQDPPGFHHQVFRTLQVLDHPEGHHDVEVVFGVR